VFVEAFTLLVETEGFVDETTFAEPPGTLVTVGLDTEADPVAAPDTFPDTPVEFVTSLLTAGFVEDTDPLLEELGTLVTAAAPVFAAPADVGLAVLPGEAMPPALAAAPAGPTAAPEAVAEAPTEAPPAPIAPMLGAAPGPAKAMEPDSAMTANPPINAFILFITILLEILS
jgi:hypothetical protein